MKLNVRALSLSVATLVAILYVLCVVAIVSAPETTVAVFDYLSHTDLSSIMRPLSWGGVFLGLVAWTLASMVVTAATAAVYNRLVGTKGSENN